MEHFYENIQGYFDFSDFYSDVVKIFDNDSRFVEVGTWKGRSLAYLAVEVINSGKNIKIDAVDTWNGSFCQHDESSSAYEPLLKEPDALYKHFLSNIEPVKDVINIVRLPSLEAAKLYDDCSLDFVFIDAEHEMPYVLDDFRAWYPKVRTGGWFAGHDAHYPAVQEALNIFCNERGVRYNFQSSSSFLIKV